MSKANIGIIGGSGLYQQEMFKDVEVVKVSTPYGEPSAPIEIGKFFGKDVAFLPRHGKAHTIPPHKVNYRANIWAMKELGVERIISPCAVGSLKENYAPGDFVFPDQYIDFTKKREYTFYDGGKTYHISTADPFCPELMELFYSNAKELNISSHKEGTYICIEGPRFSTRAESRMFKTFGDVIGMTLVPEVQLARELEICYISVAMVTDYDVWDEKPVNVEQILSTLKENMKKSQELLKTVIPKIGEKRNCNCKKALEGSEV